MRVKERMTQPLATCHVNDGLHVAAQLMWDRNCGAVPVVNDDGQLVGILTDRDICMAAYVRGLPLDAILVNSVMTKHVISADPEQDLHDIEMMMRKGRVRRIPVVDQDNRPIGIVSQADFA